LVSSGKAFSRALTAVPVPLSETPNALLSVFPNSEAILVFSFSVLAVPASLEAKVAIVVRLDPPVLPAIADARLAIVATAVDVFVVAAALVSVAFLAAEEVSKLPARDASCPKPEPLLLVPPAALDTADFTAADARFPNRLLLPVVPPVLLPNKAGTIVPKSRPGTVPSLATFSPASPAAAAAIPDNKFNADEAIFFSFYWCNMNQCNIDNRILQEYFFNLSYLQGLLLDEPLPSML
jgi:hypothetical protein